MIRISFPAIVQQIKTLPDGGFRISFDAGKDACEEIKELIDHQGDMVQLACVDPDRPAASPEESWEDMASGFSGESSE